MRLIPVLGFAGLCNKKPGRSRGVAFVSRSSNTSFEDAVQKGIDRADKTLDKVKGAWINEMKVDVEDGKVTAYRVNMKVTFILKD